MMTTRTNLRIVVALMLLAFCSLTLATWTEPVPVPQVNTEYGDRSPFLSYDGLTLYFSRVDTPHFYYHRIYQAIREDTSALFTEVAEISSLNYSGGHVPCPWVSPDNLRMYYHRTEPGSRHRLKVSKRESTDNPWLAGDDMSELNILGNLNDPSLTQDELTIVFMGYNLPGGQGNYDLYTATRPDLNSPFGNVRNLTELNTPATDADPFISPDGRSLYFASNINGDYQIYKATRESLEEPFGVIEHLSFFDTHGANSRFPSISSDGNAFYFCRELEGAVVSADIYVSYISDIYEAETYYIDAVNGNDSNNGLSPETAFATIQKGIDSAEDGSTVLVYPGVYIEEVNFNGKAITVQSAAEAAMLENPYGFAVSFNRGEGPNSVLRNLVIRNSFMGILIAGSSPTISNVTVVDNTSGIAAYDGSEPDISNSIFWNNTYGDLVGCDARYSFVRQVSEPLEGLISYWKFDEDQGSIAYDSAGDNHGTIHGAQRTAGQINGALSFDGEDDYVALPDNSPVWLPQFDFSFSAWVYFERDSISLPSESEVILDLNYGASADPENELGYNIQRRGESRRLCFQMTTTTNSDEDLYSNEVLATKIWHHIVAVREGGIQAIYVNGLLDESRTCSDDPIDFVGGYDDDRINIGRFTTNIGHPRYHLKGKIDDVMIFDRALSAEAIQQLYQSGLSPLFADPANDDYHLRSERGRYWPLHDVWVLDKVTSPCIDGGDPTADPSGEPMPNGGFLNMGVYGGTPYASMSEMPCFDPDVNQDGIVNPLDLAELIDEWLDAAGWSE